MKKKNFCTEKIKKKKKKLLDNVVRSFVRFFLFVYPQHVIFQFQNFFFVYFNFVDVKCFVFLSFLYLHFYLNVF